MNAPRPLQSPERPDPGHVGREAVVDRDVAARVGGDTGALEIQVVGIRPAADREQHVRTDRFGRTFDAIDADRDALARARARLMHSAPVRTRDAFALEDRADRFRNVLVLAADQPRALLDHRHLRAEAPIHLRELEPDVAAADHHQMLGQPIEREHGGVGEKRQCRRCPGRSGTSARPPTLMKMRGAVSRSSPTRTVSGPSKRACPRITVHPDMPRSQRSMPLRALADDRVGARLHSRHVDCGSRRR